MSTRFKQRYPKTLYISRQACCLNIKVRFFWKSSGTKVGSTFGRKLRTSFNLAMRSAQQAVPGRFFFRDPSRSEMDGLRRPLCSKMFGPVDPQPSGTPGKVQMSSELLVFQLKTKTCRRSGTLLKRVEPMVMQKMNLISHVVCWLMAMKHAATQLCSPVTNIHVVQMDLFICSKVFHYQRTTGLSVRT